MTGPGLEADDFKKDRNVLDKAHAFVDSHIRLVKNSVCVVAGVGVVLIARSIHMTKIFRKLEDIPKEVITKHFKLLGKVTGIGEFGVLQIQHIPILEMKIPLISKKQKVTSIPIHLGCVNVSPHGHKWLVDNVHNKRVWFTLLYSDSTSTQTKLYAAVELPKKLRNTRVNEELIRQGLCKVAFLDTDYSSFPEDKFLTKYLEKLVQLESQASSKKVGLWGGVDLQAKEKNKRLKNTSKIVTSVVFSPYNLIKWIISKIRRK